MMSLGLSILCSMIPDHIKEEVKASADIVEVISDYVKLRRSGSNFSGLCPFHNEKSPSFNVSPSLGIYKCFGCGESGDVYSFVMKQDGISFTEAIRTIGARFGIDVPEEQQPEQDENFRIKEAIYHALAYAGKFYFHQLTKTEAGEPALKYLEKRGFTGKTIRSYGLGYAPDGFDALLNTATNAGIKEQFLEEGGLIKYSQNGDKAFDAFRNRLMFPIFNAAGKVIGFGGRVMAGKDGTTPKNAPKYINSPQTKVYNKSEVLYGIHVAKNEIRKYKEAILVEGYTDVISLHQADIKNVVATSGTSITKEQLKVMHRYGETLLMIYDADMAGQNAMTRGLTLALNEGLDVRLLQLPDGEDPDSFVKQFGKESFIKYKDKEARDFVTFLIDKSKKSGEWEDPIYRKKVIGEVLHAIAFIADEITRETYVQKLSDITDIGTRPLSEELGVHRASIQQSLERDRRAETQTRNREQLFATGGGSVPPIQQHSGDYPQNAGIREDWNSAPWPEDGARQSQRQSSPQAEILPKRKPPFEREILRLMLQYMHPMVKYVSSLCQEEFFEDPDYRMLYNDIVQRYEEGKPISVAVYTEKESPFPELVGEVVFDRYSLSSKAQDRLKKRIMENEEYRIAQGELRTMQIHYLDRLKQDYQQRYAHATDKSEKEECQSKLIELSRERVRFANGNLEELFPSYE